MSETVAFVIRPRRIVWLRRLFFFLRRLASLGFQPRRIRMNNKVLRCLMAGALSTALAVASPAFARGGGGGGMGGGGGGMGGGGMHAGGLGGVGGGTQAGGMGGMGGGMHAGGMAGGHFGGMSGGARFGGMSGGPHFSGSRFASTQFADPGVRSSTFPVPQRP